MSISKKPQTANISIRVTERFRERAEEAARRAQLPSFSEFVKLAVIERAKRLGIRIDRYE